MSTGTDPAAAADPDLGQGGAVDGPCGDLRPHLGPHSWIAARELPAPAGESATVVLTTTRCPGVPGVSAEFIDHREVTVVRCYGADAGGARCTRMLVFDGGSGIADTDMHGWTMREHYAGGVGDRVWACPVHS